MQFQENQLYHIYNRGNDKQTIFYNRDNYLFFLRKVRKFILPVCDILNYCLMPNHFHFLIHANKKTVQTRKTGVSEKNVLSEGFRILLSSYAFALNNQKHSTGSLFQQNTKAKCLDDNNLNYAAACFHYIHQNPLKAGMVQLMENWEYSSFRDYAGFRDGSICNKKLAYQLLDLKEDSFYEDSYKMIDRHEARFIF